MKGLSCVVVLLLATTSPVAVAGISDVVPLGDGTYMVTGKNATVFGSADGIAAKLITKAHAYCKESSGTDARLIEKDGESAVMGVRTATSTVRFKCNVPAETRVTTAATGKRHFVVLEDGKVSFQITLIDQAECESLAATVRDMPGVCTASSQAAALPALAVIADSRSSDDVLLVRSQDLETCRSLTTDLMSGGAVALSECSRAN